ncbi:MAG: hypothetical protein KGL39_19375 [Patescibacteria group bacterium]|nr:hypothetical protein [Patescibacteria group bacterium]
MKIADLIRKSPLTRVYMANNLHSAGWSDGYLVVRFNGKPTLYIYGPNIPEAERDKLFRSPYPDKLFETNIRNKYKCHKVTRRE